MAKGTWDAETEALIKQFRALVPTEEGFELRSGVTVIDPVKFHKALELEIAGGPRGARARMGALTSDLKDYLAIQKGRSPKEAKSLQGET